MAFRHIVEAALEGYPKTKQAKMPKSIGKQIDETVQTIVPKKKIINADSVSKSSFVDEAWLKCPYLKHGSEYTCLRFMSLCAKEKCSKQYMRKE